MKHIVKRNQLIQQMIDSWLTQAKRRNQANWEHFRSEDEGHEIYAATKKSLIDEQGAICCYCEQRIEESSSHVEHFSGKARHPQKVFDYTNLHASCNGFANAVDHCCGHKRAEKGNPDLPISPLDENCESRFRYTGLGEVKPAKDKDADAENIIAALALDSPKLRGMRRRLMIELEGCLAGMSEEEFSEYIDQKLSQDEHGRFPPFFTTIRQYADDLCA